MHVPQNDTTMYILHLILHIPVSIMCPSKNNIQHNCDSLVYTELQLFCDFCDCFFVTRLNLIPSLHRTIDCFNCTHLEALHGNPREPIRSLEQQNCESFATLLRTLDRVEDKVKLLRPIMQLIFQFHRSQNFCECIEQFKTLFKVMAKMK